MFYALGVITRIVVWILLAIFAVVAIAGLIFLLLNFATNVVTAITSRPPAPPPTVAPAGPVAGCLNPSVISPEKDWKRVVWDCNNRIWQDMLLPEANRPAFDASFTAPFGGSAVFNGVNATLMYDPGKTGTPTVVVATNGNNLSITLVEGGWYKVKSGPFNGGFEIKR